jgi:predicted NBD/HSP70 family sugar kinase
MHVKFRRNRSYGGTSLKGLRRNNRGLVYRAIWDLKSVSRAELATVTGLHPATITHIVDGLLDDQMILEAGATEAPVGRPPLQLKINTEAAYIVSVSLARTVVSAALIDLGGNVGEDVHFSGLNLLDEQEYTITRLQQAIQLLLERAQGMNREVIGIGVGFPGPVDPSTGQTYLPEARGLREPLSFSLRNVLTERFKQPIFIDNDANAMAMAEKYFGAGQSTNDFVCIDCSLGIGASIVINGEIYYGLHGNAGEIAHNTVNIEGKLCECGRRGCLSCYAAISAIIQQVAEATSFSPQTLSVNQIAALYTAGNKETIDIIQQIATYLGHEVINIVNLVAPEVVILTGDLDRLAPIMAAHIQQQMRDFLAAPLHESIKVVSSHLKRASLQGAAVLVIRKICETGTLTDFSSH